MKTVSNKRKVELFPTKKRLLFTFVASLMGFIICFLALEVYVRFTRPKIDLYELTGRLPVPNPMSYWALIDAFSAYRGKPGQYVDGKMVNKFGFISTPEITISKPNNTIRIIFLGGSSTAGTGWNLRDEETWPWQTIQLLKKNTKLDVDFINAALGGYTSFESYGRLWSRLRHFSPDIVILTHGWNEMYYFNQSEDIVNWRTLKDGSWEFDLLKNPTAIYSPHFADSLIRWSQLLTVFRLSVSKPNNGEIGPSVRKQLKSNFNHKGLEIWRTNLKLIRELCRVTGARLFVLKQATLITPDLPASERRKCRYDFHGFDHNAHVEAFRGIYQVISDEIDHNFIIDTTVLSGHPELFFDHIHPNPVGTRKIASIVSQALNDYVEEIGASQPDDSADAINQLL